MHRLALPPAVSAIIVAFAASLAAAQTPPGTLTPSQPAPTFKSGVTTVPIDVRVIDRNGKPVTDLKQEDFSVFEDGVLQSVTQFSQQILAAGSSGPALRARPESAVFDMSPQSQRVFLIVIGAGALGSRPLGSGTALVPDPSKSLDGLLHLLRNRLLPQDQVALLAYNRASDFSADHDGMARLLETFRQSEGEFVAALTRKSAPTAGRLPAASAVAVPADPLATSQDELGFAEYVNGRIRPTSDVENLAFGIKYLRFVAGEKHLLFLTAKGIQQPPTGTMEPEWIKQWEDFGRLAAMASDARVALHVIQTGGIPADPGVFVAPLPVLTPRILVPGQTYFGMNGSYSYSSGGGGGAAPRQPGFDRPEPGPPVPIPGMDAVGLMAMRDLRTLALQTGGHASILGDAAAAIDRIDTQTRVDYLVSYNPSNPAWDGRYRYIRVEVNRPGVTVLFRHGYYADQQAASLSRRSVVAETRLAAAAASTRQLREIPVSAMPTFTKDRNGKGGELLLQLVIGSGRLGWSTDELSRRVVHLDVAVLCGDERNRVVGQTRRVLDVTMSEERFIQTATQGLLYVTRIPVQAPPSFFKVVVYNYDSNLTGSTVVRMKK